MVSPPRRGLEEARPRYDAWMPQRQGEDDLFEAQDLPPGPARGSRPARPLAGVPLAERLRPRTLDEVIGQQHLLGARQAAACRLRIAPAAFDDLLGPARASARRRWPG